LPNRQARQQCKSPPDVSRLQETQNAMQIHPPLRNYETPCGHMPHTIHHSGVLPQPPENAVLKAGYWSAFPGRVRLAVLYWKKQRIYAEIFNSRRENNIKPWCFCTGGFVSRLIFLIFLPPHRQSLQRPGVPWDQVPLPS